MRKSVPQIVVPAAVAVALLLVLIALGRAARDRLRGEDRYLIALADIDCPSPPGLERGEFLTPETGGSPPASRRSWPHALAVSANELAEETPLIRFKHGSAYNRIKFDLVTV